MEINLRDSYKIIRMGADYKFNRSIPFIYALIAFFFIQGCSSNQNIDQKAVQDELATRELKRVTTTQILEKGKEIGMNITEQAQLELQQNLLSAISEGGISYALDYCKTNAMDIVNRAVVDLDVDVYRVSQKFRNPEDEPDSLENLILGAYQYSIENNIDLEPSVQEESDEYVLFTKPIVIGNGLCLNCHGSVGNQIKEEDYDVISSLYPDDNAIDYKLGDLRGMWSIRIPKKTIIQSL